MTKGPRRDHGGRRRSSAPCFITPLVSAVLVALADTETSDTVLAMVGSCGVGIVLAIVVVRWRLRALRDDGPPRRLSGTVTVLAGAGIGSLLLGAPGVIGPAVAMGMLAFLSALLLGAGLAERTLKDPDHTPRRLQ